MSVLLDQAIYAVAALPTDQQQLIARRMLRAVRRIQDARDRRRPSREVPDRRDGAGSDVESLRQSVRRQESAR